MGERIQSINAVGILVHDYDEAIAFFTEKLNFDLLANEAHDNGIRWVLLHPPGLSNAGIMLNLAQSKLDEMVVGKQAGDQVLFVLQTNDFWRDYKSMQSKGVNFIETPRDEEYGTVAIFEDLYGNKWDLLQVKDEEQAIRAVSHTFHFQTLISYSRDCLKQSISYMLQLPALFQG